MIESENQSHHNYRRTPGEWFWDRFGDYYGDDHRHQTIANATVAVGLTTAGVIMEVVDLGDLGITGKVIGAGLIWNGLLMSACAGRTYLELQQDRRDPTHPCYVDYNIEQPDTEPNICTSKM
ncbi:MAG: hypothetical protein M3P98_02235 [bacterium]|nr:hypothetical protein [bacterium]